MKIVYSNYGSPDVLKFEEIAKPILEDDDVLIKVRAASVRKLMEAGGVAPVIDGLYSLSEFPEAIRYLEQGHARGKIFITLCLSGCSLWNKAYYESDVRYEE